MLDQDLLRQIITDKGKCYSSIDCDSCFCFFADQCGRFVLNTDQEDTQDTYDCAYKNAIEYWLKHFSKEELFKILV